MEQEEHNERLRIWQKYSREKIDGYDWQPSEVVFNQVKNFYQRNGFEGKAAEEEAGRLILRRLWRGSACARVNGEDSQINYVLMIYPDNKDRPIPKKPRSWGLSDGSQAIPKWAVRRTFWRMLERSKDKGSRDWLSGDFEYEYYDEYLTSTVVGKLFDVFITACRLPGWENRGTSKDSSKVAKKEGNIAPRLSDAALRMWWNGLSLEARNLPQLELVDLCKAAFPRYSVSRDRIRELDPGRKRGPKPISGETTA